MLQSDSGISFSERRAAFAFQFRYVHGFRSVTLEAIRYKSYKRLCRHFKSSFTWGGVTSPSTPQFSSAEACAGQGSRRGACASFCCFSHAPSEGPMPRSALPQPPDPHIAPASPGVRAGPTMSSPVHVLRVQRLYRSSLKCLANWTVHRDLWIKKGFELRAEFDTNKSVTNSHQIEKLLSDGEAKLAENAHPDPYTGTATALPSSPPAPDCASIRTATG